MPVEASGPVGVQQQGDVDAVAGDERQALQQLAAGGDLAGQRLARFQPARDRRGSAAVAPSARSPGRRLGQGHLAELERAPIEALDERDLIRPHSSGPSSPQTKCAPNCAVSASRKQTTSPVSVGSERHIASPLPSTGPARASVSPGRRPRRRGARDLGRAVGRIIHDDDLVDHAELPESSRDARMAPIVARLVAGRQTDRDRLGARGGEPGGGKFGVRVGTADKPGAGASGHAQRMTARPIVAPMQPAAVPGGPVGSAP